MAAAGDLLLLEARRRDLRLALPPQSGRLDVALEDGELDVLGAEVDGDHLHGDDDGEHGHHGGHHVAYRGEARESCALLVAANVDSHV